MRFDTGETSVTFNSNQQNFYRTFFSVFDEVPYSGMSEFLLNIQSSICRCIGLFVHYTLCWSIQLFRTAHFYAGDLVLFSMKSAASILGSRWRVLQNV
jgi:hypothetical protein